MTRGEVWWGEDPIAGRRPYLILTRNEAIPVLRRVQVAPLSRTIRGAPSELVLETDDGVPERCAANFDDLVSMPKAMLTERICRLGLQRLEDVCRTLRTATGC